MTFMDLGDGTGTFVLAFCGMGMSHNLSPEVLLLPSNLTVPPLIVIFAFLELIIYPYPVGLHTCHHKVVQGKSNYDSSVEKALLVLP